MNVEGLKVILDGTCEENPPTILLGRDDGRGCEVAVANLVAASAGSIFFARFACRGNGDLDLDRDVEMLKSTSSLALNGNSGGL